MQTLGTKQGQADIREVEEREMTVSGGFGHKHAGNAGDCASEQQDFGGPWMPAHGD